MVTWGIWKYKNKLLFEYWPRQDSKIITNILLSIKDHNGAGEADKVEHILNPIYFDDKPIGFFDESVVDNRCGIGFFLKINTEHHYRAHFAGGQGNNMKAKIMGLWGLLSLENRLYIKEMMVARDSKVAIYWIIGNSILKLLYLENWKDQIRILKSSFDGINFIHGHRAYNTKADKLSKKELDFPMGRLLELLRQLRGGGESIVTVLKQFYIY
jgi:hypothetical protein